MQMHVNVVCGGVTKTNVALHCEAGRVIGRVTNRQTFRFLQEASSFPAPFYTLAGYLPIRIQTSQLNHRMGVK